MKSYILAKEIGFRSTKPSQTTLQKYFREKHNIHVIVIPHIFENSTQYRWATLPSFTSLISDMYKSYETAMERGLITTIEYLKNKR